MRIMPFMKRKKGVQFAGIGLDTGGSGGSSYVLPTATANRLGGIKVGSGLTVEDDGTLSTSGGGGGGGENYTTTEIEVGTWVDGTSKVYRKTYHFEFTDGYGSADVDTGLLNLKYLEIKGCIIAKESSGYGGRIDRLTQGQSSFIDGNCRYTGTNGKIKISFAYFCDIYMTLIYVK